MYEFLFFFTLGEFITVIPSTSFLCTCFFPSFKNSIMYISHTHSIPYVHLLLCLRSIWMSAWDHCSNAWLRQDRSTYLFEMLKLKKRKPSSQLIIILWCHSFICRRHGHGHLTHIRSLRYLCTGTVLPPLCSLMTLIIITWLS